MEPKNKLKFYLVMMWVSCIIMNILILSCALVSKLLPDNDVLYIVLFIITNITCIIWAISAILLIVYENKLKK